MRLFTSIEIPQEIKAKICEFRRNIPGLRWVVDEQLHITINFIGECDKENFELLKSLLAEIKWTPFAIKLEGGGFFPLRSKPSVLWIGLDCPPELQKIKKETDAILQNMGFPIEKRDFQPHLTIARLSRDFPASKYPFEKIVDKAFTWTFDVSEFHLFSSVLDSKGAIHTCQASYQATVSKI